VGRKALKRKLGKKVLSGSMTVTEARSRLGRKEARRQARKAQGAYSSALDEVRAMLQGYIAKGSFTADLSSPLSAAEIEYAAILARTRQQKAVVTKAAKRAGPAGPSAASLAAVAGLTKAAADANKAAADAPKWPVSFPAPPVVTRQLTGPEQRIVAAMAAERDSTGNSGRRVYLDDQIARISGLTPIGTV
jgi:hypothetical protein